MSRAPDRRRFLGQAASATAGAWLASHATLDRLLYAAEPPAAKRPQVAVIFSEFRLRSHAWNILENCFRPYLFSGKLVDPGIDIVSFYADQFPETDAARAVAKRLNVPLYDSIDAALCRGGKELAVDGVISIVEHGDYPDNELGQRLYPRKEFFDQSLAVMKRSNRFVPFFNDKHLSYRWDWAKEMYDTARRHKFPLLAGSSVPLAQRMPEFSLPAGAEIEEVVAMHGGGLEVYGFHGLEILQALVEGRRGGETGISQIEFLAGEGYESAGKSGRWSPQLVAAAMKAETSSGVKRRPRQLIQQLPAPAKAQQPAAICVQYKDGLKATVLQTEANSSRWNLALRLKGENEPRAFMHFNGPWGNRCLFRALAHAIQQFIIEKKEPYPAERTLLTTGAIDAAMHSLADGGRPVATPQLEFAYQPNDWSRFRENGGSWRILTAESEENSEFEPGDEKRVATVGR